MNNFELIFFIACAFLLLRELFCWYFKVNKRLSLLSDIKDELVQANKYRNEDATNCRDEDVNNHSSIDAVRAKEWLGGGGGQGGSEGLDKVEELIISDKAIRKLIKNGPILRM
tara:strand:+ start:346 stop:684 length:339 start_codon:yes stop_codon:yes gene_type:complete